MIVIGIGRKETNIGIGRKETNTGIGKDRMERSD